MREFDQDDWLAQRLEVLKPGWRGRLRLLAPEDAKGYGQAELIGTIVEEPIFNDEEEAPDDPTITFCVNHHGGHFTGIAGEPRCTIRVSQIAEMEAM